MFPRESETFAAVDRLPLPTTTGCGCRVISRGPSSAGLGEHDQPQVLGGWPKQP